MSGAKIRERDLRQAAWREWVLLAAYRGDLGPAEHRWPPRRFVAEELGFGFDHGPSLAWTCSTLGAANREALRRLKFEAPRRVTYPKNFDSRGRSRRTPAKVSRPPRGESISEIVARALSRSEAQR